MARGPGRSEDVAVDVRSELAGRADEAIAAGDAGALRAVIHAALDASPPRVSLPSLRAWRDSGLLGDDDPHRWWLEAACQANGGRTLAPALDDYERARLAFAERGDVAEEIAVGMAASHVARRLDDLPTIGRFIIRAGELAALGHPEAAAPARLGEALVAQMLGDPAGALRALDSIEPGAIEGDWAAQLSMIRGTNLLLVGRTQEAEAHLEHGAGAAGSWAQSIALQLLATGAWRDGSPVRALRLLDAAESAALAVRAPGNLAQIRSMRVTLLATLGDPDAPAELARLLASPANDPECLRLLAVARAHLAVGNGDLAGAAEIVEGLDLPERGLPSTLLAIALGCATSDAMLERWQAADERSPLRPAVDAGTAARAHLHGGTLAGDVHRPFLRPDWCEPEAPVIELSLLGRASISVDRRPADASQWARGRVRELALYLALEPGGGRDLAADRLWPELTSEAAARNLRVTLTYLRGALAPDAERPGDPLIVEQDGTLALARDPRLHIDVRDEADALAAIRDAAALDDRAAMLSAARRLARVADGPLLGGASVGSWIDVVARRRREDVLVGVALAGNAAIDAGDPELAEAMAQRGLEHDPWSERLHQLLVHSRSERDDLDGARRAMRDALDRLAELKASPEAETVELARSIGLAVD